MRNSTRLSLTLVLALLGCGSVLAASAQISMTVLDGDGKPFKDALITMAMVDDPAQSVTVSEDEAGLYAASVKLDGETSAWRITRVVATGYLPMQISIASRAGGKVIQDVQAMELNPGIPIPEIEVGAGGNVQIRLVLGERSVVMERFAKARAEAEAAEPAEEPEPQVDSAYADALRLYGEGDVDGAIPYFEKAVAAHPDDTQMRVTYANVLYKARRFDEFEKVARTVIEADPDNGEMMMMIYSSARERGDMKAALEALLAVKQAGLGGSDLLAHLDYVAKKMGQSPDAIPAYLAILDLDGDNVGACRTLAALYAKTGDTAKSEQYLARAVELAPERAPTIYLDLAGKLLDDPQADASEIERGVQLIRKAIAADPSAPAPYKTLGLALWKQEKYPDAREAFQKYLDVDPEAPDKDQILDYLSRLTD